MKKIPLHIQIFAALILGTVFGIIFHVDHHEIYVNYLHEGKNVEGGSSGWEYAAYLSGGDTLATFDAKEQSAIVNRFSQLKKDKTKNVVLVFKTGNKIQVFKNIISVRKPDTPATVIKPIGTLFIRLLSFLAIPLVIATLIRTAIPNVKLAFLIEMYYKLL